MDIETYAKDLQSFVNTYERMDEARKYQDVSFISNWGDFYIGRERFIEALCDYIEFELQQS